MELREDVRKDVERRNAISSHGNRWRFEYQAIDDDRFEVARGSGFSTGRSALVVFERVGPRINVNGDGIDVDLTAVAGLSAAGECRYFVGEAEYRGWEVRKMALDLLFFEEEE